MTFLKQNKATIYIAIIVAIAVYIIFGRGEMGNSPEDWTLSLYNNGITVLRLDYESKATCLSAGNSYEKMDRFDCGLNCEDNIDLTQSVVCEEVCNNSGCRK